MAANGAASATPAQGTTASKPRMMDWSLSSSLANLSWLTNMMIPSANATPPESPAKPAVDYTKDADTKPPFAYNLLIYDAIRECNKDKVTLGDIYRKIMEKYAYYRARPKETAWKNSIRHNLTVHDCFVKIDRDKSKNETGKGGFWIVDEALAKDEVDFGPRTDVKVGPRSRKRRRQAAAAEAAAAAAAASMAAASAKRGKSKTDGKVKSENGKSAMPSPSKKARRVSGKGNAEATPSPAAADRFHVPMLEGAEEESDELDVSTFATDAFSESQILKTLASDLAHRDIDAEDGGHGGAGELTGASGTFGNSFAKLVGSFGGGMKQSFSSILNDSFRASIFNQSLGQSQMAGLEEEGTAGAEKFEPHFGQNS